MLTLLDLYFRSDLASNANNLLLIHALKDKIPTQYSGLYEVFSKELHQNSALNASSVASSNTQKEQISLNNALNEVPESLNIVPFHSIVLFILKALQTQRQVKWGDLDNAETLNCLGGNEAMSESAGKLFTKQCDSDLYYEQIIQSKDIIPTRENWHDFFNGLIWLQFPKLKRYLNEQHIMEIEKYGVKHRSAIRDRITHFDECGLIILTNDTGLQADIASHNWPNVFVSRKADWHDSIRPVIFGHALYEMLLTPFIGLTAKVTIIDVDKKHDVNALSNSDIDDMVLSLFETNNHLEKKRPWLPLPLLGIPGWAHQTQDSAFYSNTDYFMPKRKKN